MFELEGKYSSAKVFAATAENACVAQIMGLLNQVSATGSKIRIMPDCHAGAGCVIGTTMTVADKVIPNLVGVDIGCGMLAVRLAEESIDLPMLDSAIRKSVPAGGRIHDLPVPGAEAHDARELRCLGRSGCHASPEVFARSLGTLGGGNHFIEVDRAGDGALWLVIHTGSRRTGKDVAEFYQKSAYEVLTSSGAAAKEEASRQRKAFISDMKAEGRGRELPGLLVAWRPSLPEPKDVPYAFAYCEGESFCGTTCTTWASCSGTPPRTGRSSPRQS